jgi:MFS family permease
MPLYLGSIGYSIAIIGLLEGVAEAVASITKAYLGKWSDKLGKRVIFVQIGYGLSALSKPLIILSNAIPFVFGLRMMDRFGKGIRTSARDALLNEECTENNKASVFGFHRSMDTLGAVIGPTIALLVLYYKPHQYKLLFVLAIIPSVLSIISTLLLKEKKAVQKEVKNQVGFKHFWNNSNMEYKKIFVLLIGFAIINSSDVFLLLKLKEAGFSEPIVIALYIIYNIVYAVLAYPVGQIADSIGKYKILALGLCIFALVYFGFGYFESPIILAPLIALYGVYAAAAEGVGKALLLSHCNKNESGTAVGLFTSVQGLACIVASAGMGLLWQNGFRNLGFVISGAVALVVGFAIWKKVK